MAKEASINRWRILVCGMLCMLIMGVCYTYSLFQPHIMERFGVDSPTASLPFTIFIAVFCIGNFIGGRMQQAYSIRTTLIVGYACMVIGWGSVALLPSTMFWGMFITYGGIFGIGDGIVYNVIVSLMPKWFVDKKGLAAGLILAMMGMSATIFSPFISMWLNMFSFEATFAIISGIVALFGVFGVMTLSAPPEGYMADYQGTSANAVSKKQYEVNEVFGVKDFWVLMGLYFCAVPAYLLLSAIFVTYGQDKGLTAAMATLGVSAASLFQVGGRFLVPTISDKIGRKAAFAMSFLITAIGVGLLTVSTGYLYVFCFCLISFSYGGSQACFAPIAGDRFGTKNVGTILSLTMIGFGCGSIGASLLAKAAGVSTAFICAGVISLAGIGLVTLLSSNKEK